MDIYVENGELRIGNERFPCTLGKGGLTSDKREGDHKTPRGTYPLRQVYYRKDRVDKPQTGLPAVEIRREDGWCDDPAHPAYNTPVVLPFPASHEKLWREDHAYDVCVVIGYNDAPVMPGKGSAIFFHLSHDDGRGTEGCVAASLEAMQRILRQLTPRSRIHIL